MEREVVLTEDGYNKLTEEIEHLKDVKRREVAERIKEAREFGDISENSAYDDAKNDEAPPQATDPHATEPQATLDHAADPQATEPHATLAQAGSDCTVLVQSAASKTGVGPPCGSGTRKRSKARFGLGGSTTAAAASAGPSGVAGGGNTDSVCVCVCVCVCARPAVAGGRCMQGGGVLGLPAGVAHRWHQQTVRQATFH